MADQTLPRDQFSVRRRELADNPGALASSSTLQLADVYGNLETWVLETFRADGQETAFLQRNSADGGIRLMLPPEVMAALRRQQAGTATRSRRRGARQAVETKRTKGIPVGNAAALARARKKRKGGGK